MKGERYCGLDFGTTNSTVGIVRCDQCSLVDLSRVRGAVFPSAIFFNLDEEEILYGYEAIDSYLAGRRGRIMWAPKNVLGSSLMDESTDLGIARLSFFSIISFLIANIKERAEEINETCLDQVVLGRPVHYNDSDRAIDVQAEEFMRNIARAVGFSDVHFEYEPIAAAVTYEQQIDDEQTALIVDMGGGTSDFSVIRVSPASRTKGDRRDDILAIGGIHVAGTDFDRELSLHSFMPLLGMGSSYKSLESKSLTLPSSTYHDLASWHKIQFIYDERIRSSLAGVARVSDAPEKIERLISVIDNFSGHGLAREVELAKIKLGQEESVSALFDTSMSPRRVAELNRHIDGRVVVDLAQIDSKRRKAEEGVHCAQSDSTVDEVLREGERRDLRATIKADYDIKKGELLSWQDQSRASVDTLRTASEHLSVTTSRHEFDECIDDLLSQIEVTFQSVIADAGLRAEQIDVIFLTGGSSLLPAVRRRLRSALPLSRFIEGDAFNSVGMGLALLAKRRFGHKK
jgi:hypothetical chaperone protein